MKSKIKVGKEKTKISGKISRRGKQKQEFKKESWEIYQSSQLGAAEHGIVVRGFAPYGPA